MFLFIITEFYNIRNMDVCKSHVFLCSVSSNFMSLRHGEIKYTKIKLSSFITSH
jgi:hypothetical protein